MSKKANGKKAIKLEKKVAYDVNNRTVDGLKVIDLFRSQFGKDLVGAQHVGGCSHHYDLIFKFGCGETKKCEVKSSSNSKSVEKWKTPWEKSGQFLNGTGDKFRIRKWYARQWYDNGFLRWAKLQFSISQNIPDFETWFSKDMSVTGSPQTDFGLALKNYITDSEPEERTAWHAKKAEFVKNLVVPQEVIEQLVQDYNRESYKVLNDKEVWLCYGSQGEVQLWDHIPGEEITSEQLLRELSSKDLVYKFTNPSDGIVRQIRIRFQNGIGIANISVQCS